MTFIFSCLIGFTLAFISALMAVALQQSESHHPKLIQKNPQPSKMASSRDNSVSNTSVSGADADIVSLHKVMKSICNIKTDKKILEKKLAKERADRADIIETSLEISVYNTGVIIRQSDELRKLRSESSEQKNELRVARDRIAELKEQLSHSVKLCDCVARAREEFSVIHQNSPECCASKMYAELDSSTYIEVEAEFSGPWGSLLTKPKLLSCLEREGEGQIAFNSNGDIIIKFEDDGKYPRQRIELLMDERTVYKHIQISGGDIEIPNRILSFYSSVYPRTLVTIRVVRYKKIKTEKIGKQEKEYYEEMSD